MKAPMNILKEYLNKYAAEYETIGHPASYTAQETAAEAHVSGNELAKPVVVQVDGELLLVVVPAPMKLDLTRLADLLGASELELVEEKVFKDRFAGFELGAIPPFGELFEMDVLLDERLSHAQEIAFKAGSHNELIRMPFDEYERLAKPKILEIPADAD